MDISTKINVFNIDFMISINKKIFLVIKLKNH